MEGRPETTLRLRSLAALGASLLFVLSPCAFAAGRPRYGGTVKIAYSGRVETDPPLADPPVDAAVASLTSPRLCRELADGVRLEWASAITWTAPAQLHISLRTAAPASPALTASQVTRAWTRLTSTPSPYRALLFPIRADAQLTPLNGGLDLPLAFPFPDLDRALCHPSLAIGADPTTTPVGPFAPGAGGAIANLGYPLGRPFLDRVSLLSLPDRALSRALALHQAQVVLGSADDGAPVGNAGLWATYLAFSPAKAGPELRAAFEASIDRGDLTRFFVRGPAAPMRTLLPPALMSQPAGPVPTRAAPAIPGRRALTVLYDSANEDHRAVAERLQVKLHDRGYALALRPVPRAELRAAWASGNFDLLLDTVLLPPAPSAALAVVLELAGRHDLLATELPSLGAIADAEARGARARDEAERLRPQLPLLPLYARGLHLELSPGLTVPMDAYGLPLFDEATQEN